MPDHLENDLSRGEESVDIHGELRYTGLIDHQTLSNFVQMSLTDNDRFHELLDCYQAYTRAHHITVELMQNVNRHGARWGTEKVIHEPHVGTEGANNCPCWISYHLLVTEAEVIIRCANFVVESMRQKLEAKLGNSNSLSPEAKRMQYMAQLSTGMLSERGGAGLGLIEIARKSSEFNWWFSQYGQDRLLFTVESRLNRQELRERQERFRARLQSGSYKTGVAENAI